LLDVGHGMPNNVQSSSVAALQGMPVEGLQLGTVGKQPTHAMLHTAAQPYLLQ
jgi:hypothetical protein